ncbi:putative inositol oxygenase [Spathaspora sp. JA1]|nr:putative inositol oxygenase [Spathaspora sp. JA1]
MAIKKQQEKKNSVTKPCDTSSPEGFAKEGKVLGHVLEKLDDEILNINRMHHGIRGASTIKRPTIEEEITLHDSGQEDTANENWHIASEYYKNIDTKAFRQYDLACDRVKQFYEEQHEQQTVAYNIQARINFKTKTRARMTIWEGLEKLNKLLDDSDPDTELSQIDHALQTAEAIRRDGKPRWFQLVGLIHDLGKLLYFFDSKGQWDVVGDTFPVGCKFSKRIIFPDSFKKNPDFLNPLYNTKYGIYSKHCGLDKVMLSWGHDEYMYHVAKNNSSLPQEALAMIRYHSFYPWHQEYAYSYLMDDHDKEMLKAVRAFNTYDLYSKIDQQYDVEELKPYYLELIDEFFPNKTIDF